MYCIRNGIAAAMLAAGIASTTAFAQNGPPPEPAPPPPPMDEMHHGHGGPGGHFGPKHMYEQLGLSADQKSKSDAVFAAKGPQLKRLHEQMHANMEKIHALSPDDPNYRATVAQLAQNGGTLASQMITAESEMRAELWAILTPEQRTRLAAMEKKMGERMREHKGHWDHHQGPPGPPPQE